MEKFIELLQIIGVSIYLTMLLYCVFIIVLIVIHIISKLSNRFKVGKIVYSSLYGYGKIRDIKEDGTIIVRYPNHTQPYDSKGRAVVQTMFRSGLKSTIKDNVRIRND